MISQRWTLAVIAVVLTMLLPIGVQAQDVTFQLNDVTFADGGTASGTFTYDFDSGASSKLANWNITTTPGTAIPTSQTYSTGQGYFANPSGYSIFFYGSPYELDVGFLSPLSPSGASIQSISEHGDLGNRTGNTGSVTPVPLPAGIWLLLGGLALIGFTQSRRTDSGLPV